MLRLCAAAAAVVILGGCAGSPAPETGPRGHLVIVGGGPRPDAIMDRFIELAGGRGEARIAVIPMSSASPEETGESLVEEMLRRGAASAVNVNLAREQAMDPARVALLDGITGVWFAGGDQSRHTDALRGTPVEAAIHRLYMEGAVLGGTSAGAAIMSGVMITGGEIRPGGDRPVEDASYVTIDRDNVRWTDGFGFLDNAIVDQHFVRRRRNNRLISVVLEHPHLIGVGIDESTAVIVDPGGRWTVVGNSVALIYDARAAGVTGPESGGALGATDLRVHILPHGGAFDPATGVATLPPGSPAVAAGP